MATYCDMIVASEENEMPKDLGRVDWMPRKKIWRVIWYQGTKDIPKGDYPTREQACIRLQELVDIGNIIC